MYPEKFENLIEEFSKLPGVGGKTAERYAFTLLGWNDDDINELAQVVKDIKKLKTCEMCGNLSEQNICEICQDESRNTNQICVVKDIKDLYSIENTGAFSGVYHVLGGLIDTRKGILPEDLKIEDLLKRIKPETEEVILALDPTIQGETTGLYLEKLLQDQVHVSRLAYGISVGSHLDYTDKKRLERAFEGRK